ncbi:MAG: gamma carbonic anhydrase family protein [Christensenellales bacterium]
MIIDFEGKSPKIGKNVFIAPTATVIGDVTIGDNVSIWFGAVLRGDENSITVGDNTNIQENSTIHVDSEYPVVIGSGVTVGHNCIVHGATVGDDCMIGMGSVLLNGSVVKKGALVGAGALLLQHKVVEEKVVAVGNPCKPKRECTEEDLENIRKNARFYVDLIKKYK